jgi:hypothetical protein
LPTPESKSKPSSQPEAGILSKIAESIATLEGYYRPGTLAQRKNNPGNLVFVGQEGAKKDPQSRFASFDSTEAGWNALKRQVLLDASRGKTLQEFVYKYAPPTENNSARYLTNLSRETGIPPDSILSKYLTP